MSFEWIDTDDKLRDLCEHLSQQDWIAVDTEFHRERTYYAQLALVQLASPERVACVDPLAVDLRPVDELMRNDKVLKVFHAGRQDLEIFFDRSAAIPKPFFDTQIAAALVGRGEQLGYAALVSQLTEAHVQKLHGRTDWMRRPLDAAVLEYAADDVRHLRDVYRKLDDELRELKRHAWLEEEQAYLLEVDTYRVPEEDAWRSVKGTGRLKGVERAVARELGAWRERRARDADRPRRRVLSDEVIVDLARQRPKSVQAMERLRALDSGTRKKFGEELVKVIEAGASRPESEWPPAPEQGPQNVDDAVVDALGALLTLLARDANIAPRILATRGDLERLVAGEDKLEIARGWRAELAGAQLKSFLKGELGLRVREARLEVD